jgi:hypothetical protein
MHQLQPLIIDTETKERRQVATVDGWQHCWLARHRQLVVPAAQVLLHGGAAVPCILLHATNRWRTFNLLF